MITRQFAFFSFMLGWTFLGRFIGIPFPMIMLPILYMVSGPRYTFYFFALNMLLFMPNIINAFYIGNTYGTILGPFIHQFQAVNQIQNLTARNEAIKQLGQQYVNNITSGTPLAFLQTQPHGYTIGSLFGQLWLIAAYGLAIPFFRWYIIVLLKFVRKYLSLYRMIKSVTRKQGILKSHHT